MSQNLSDIYELLTEVKGSIGGEPVYLGEAKNCRFCHPTGDQTFKKKAHTFPEFLGSKWVFSRDECDQCNSLFSQYESDLANALAPLLTFSGTRGKHNSIRQTGRSAGPAVLRRSTGEGGDGIQFQTTALDFSDSINIDQQTGEIELRFLVPTLSFVPRNAYKALCKMGFAILPTAEFCHFEGLRSWLQQPRDKLDFPILDVGISTGNIGKALPMISGQLYRRKIETAPFPYILFVLFAGSICALVDLLADGPDSHLPPIHLGAINPKLNVILSGTNEREAHRIEYGQLMHFNWTNTEPIQKLIEDIYIRFNPRSSNGQISFQFASPSGITSER